MTAVHGEYERIRQGGRPGYVRSRSLSSFNRERLLQLSQPKEPKTEWYTSVGPHVRWGTQEMLWPIKDSSMQRQPTERIIALSAPKSNFLKGDKITRPEFYYSCGRSSVIWDVKPTAQEARASERIKALAEPKKLHQEYKENIRSTKGYQVLSYQNLPQYSYSCGRESPIWGVTKHAMSCGERPHTQQLARHKTPHPEFLPEKPVQTPVPPAALKTVPSERLIALANPKERPEGPFRSPTWEVPDNVKNASASTRCTELARPKGIVDGYQLPKDVEWPVPRAAKRAVITSRMEELAKPVIRASMDHVQFNPDAFMVKPFALKGSFPSRIDRLSKPIDR